MATNDNKGFIEHRHLTGSVVPSTRWYKVKANGRSGSFQKFPGDPVVLVSGQSVGRMVAINSAASSTVLGVIRACFTDAKRPLTFNQPNTGGGFIPASTAGWVEVNVDPFQTYLVNSDATVHSTFVGQYVNATAATPTTAVGRSGFAVTLTGASNTAANTLPFQIISIADNNLDGIVEGDGNNQDVEVRIANHAFLSFNKSL